MKKSDTCARCTDEQKNIMHLHETIPDDVDVRCVTVVNVVVVADVIRNIMYTYRFVAQPFSTIISFAFSHFVPFSFCKLQQIEDREKLILFLYWMLCKYDNDDESYLLDRHGNYGSLRRCRVFWFVHKLCIVNGNKSMACMSVRNREKDVGGEKKKTIIFEHCKNKNCVCAHQVLLTGWLACLTLN